VNFICFVVQILSGFKNGFAHKVELASVKNFVTERLSCQLLCYACLDSGMYKLSVYTICQKYGMLLRQSEPYVREVKYTQIGL